MKTEMLHVRVDAELKKGVEALFQDLGMSTSSAVTLFFQQALYKHGLPFQVVLPNDVTERAFKNAEQGRGVHAFDSMDELVASLKE